MHPRNDHSLPLESIILHNTDSSDDDELWERPLGFTLEGTNEVRTILENLDKMIIVEGNIVTYIDTT